MTVLFGDGAGAAVLQATEVTDPATDPHIYSTHALGSGFTWAGSLVRWSRGTGEVSPLRRGGGARPRQE